MVCGGTLYVPLAKLWAYNSPLVAGACLSLRTRTPWPGSVSRERRQLSAPFATPPSFDRRSLLLQTTHMHIPPCKYRGVIQPAGTDLRGGPHASHQKRASHQTVHSLFLANDRCLRYYDFVVAQWRIQDFCKGGAAAGAFGVPQAPSCPLSLQPLRKFRGS